MAVVFKRYRLETFCPPQHHFCCYRPTASFFETNNAAEFISKRGLSTSTICPDCYN